MLPCCGRFFSQDAADTTSVTTFMTEELSEVSVESLEQAEGLPEMALRKTQVSEISPGPLVQSWLLIILGPSHNPYAGFDRGLWHCYMGKQFHEFGTL